MRYVNIDNLKSVFDTLHGKGAFDLWEKDAKSHAKKLEGLSQSERSKHWKDHNVWSKLYDALSELSSHKCWYTESKENSSEWQVDHFRPKAKSIDESGEIILKEGYWWMSYYWRNFRLSGNLCNLLRKDRFTDSDDVFGKGNFFPIKDVTKKAKEKDIRCRGEKPVLLDPTVSRDVSLISFDQNGSVYATYNIDDDSHNNFRAQISIKCYGLDHSSLIRGRKRVWDECNSVVELTHNDLRIHIDDDELIDSSLEECFQRLSYLASREQPFSMVVINYIQEKLKDEDFFWLNDALKAIA